MGLSKTLNDIKNPSSKVQNVENLSNHNGNNTVLDTQLTFGDMQLKVNDKLQIQLVSFGNRNRKICLVKLIGYIQNHVLMVSEPSSSQITGHPLLEGDELAIFYFNGQTLFKFTSYVEKIITIPIKYIHLSYPKHITGKKIRKTKRIETCIEASINDSSKLSIITNISMTGAEIATSYDIGPLGSVIDLFLMINLQEKETKLQLKAIVKSFNITHTNLQNPLIYGVEFTSLQHNQSLILNNFINQRLIDDSLSIVK